MNPGTAYLTSITKERSGYDKSVPPSNLKSQRGVYLKHQIIKNFKMKLPLA